jgi:polyhydroxyalkanoate synthesis regulator phasin
MPLTLEQFKQLRAKGLTPQQIANFEAGQKPTEQKEQGVLSKLADNPVTKAFEGTANFLFGSTAKTVGGMITGGIGDAKVVKGSITNNPKEIEQGKKLQAVRDENINKLNTIFTAIELYPGGGLVTNALKKMPGGQAVAKMIVEHIPQGLRAGAVKQFSEALGATTKELKSKTEKVVPELVRRGKTITSMSKFAEEASALKNQAGQAVKSAENIIPVFKKQAVDPLIQKVSKLRNQFLVNGKILDEGAVKAVDNVVNSITQFGKEIPETQLIKIKRVLDKSVAIGNKNFTKDEGLSLAIETKQGIANAIRNTLNSSNPKLAAANKEFSLWADVSKIVETTLERRSTQTGGLTRFIGPLIGGGAGLASGDLTKAVVGYFATSGAIKLLQSPIYKTISAKTKNELANYIASGKINEALILTAKLLAGTKNEISK